MSAHSWGVARGRPPVFRGSPPLLVADVELDNPSDHRVRPGKLALRVDGDDRDYFVRIPSRLPPRRRAKLRVHLLVDRSMPPGSYRASIHTPEAASAVELRVFVRRTVSVIPRIISLAGASGDTVTADLFLENLGNVECVMERAGQVFFEEVDWLGRALVFALRESGPHESFPKYQDRVLGELRSSMPHTTSIAIDPGLKVLSPGESAEARLEMTLPQGLQKGRTYSAFLDLAGTRLRLELACTGSTHSRVRRSR